ncbi:hypothetical protein TNCV_4892151 [Trichonephila clavipes]|nr:hypothetical protein TNCV_4892151 [Trichonephila clavipes]
MELNTVSRREVKADCRYPYCAHEWSSQIPTALVDRSKAGGYAIQDRGGTLIEGIDGDYYNVVGLPAHRVAREIRDLLEANLL